MSFAKLNVSLTPDPRLALEGGIDRHPIAVGEPVGFVGHADHGHDLAEHGFGHAGLARRGAMAGDAVAAAIGDADREVDHFLGQRIERAWRHDLLDALPGALERRRIVRQVFPKVVDVVDIAGALDVVEHGADCRIRLSVFDRTNCAHHRLLLPWPTRPKMPPYDAAKQGWDGRPETLH